MARKIVGMSIVSKENILNECSKVGVSEVFRFWKAGVHGTS